MQDYFLLLISAVLVNNIVLTKFLGICPFLGVSKKLSTALGMSGAVVFVMTLSNGVTTAIYKLILVKDAPLLKADISFMQIIVFILVIASLVQLVEVVLQKLSPPLYKALGIYLPLITTNCAVLGAANMVIKSEYGIVKSAFFGCASGLSFTLALVLFSSLREKLDLAKVPECMRGTAIALITAGILAMAFMGFSGLVKI